MAMGDMIIIIIIHFPACRLSVHQEFVAMDPDI